MLSDDFLGKLIVAGFRLGAFEVMDGFDSVGVGGVIVFDDDFSSNDVDELGF